MSEAVNLTDIADRNRQRRQMKSTTTPGPWHVVQLDDDHAMSLVGISTVADDGRNRRWPDFDSGELVAATLVQQPRYVDVADVRWEENAAFIAFARGDSVEDDVDALLAEVERLRRQVDAG